MNLKVRKGLEKKGNLTGSNENDETAASMTAVATKKYQFTIGSKVSSNREKTKMGQIVE